jgi:diketogulonate reductase-like aldo/keto reductase
MEQYGKVWGEGDQKVLDGFKELQKMKDEGLIKSIGITGMASLVSSMIISFLKFIRISTSYSPQARSSYSA